MKKKLFDMNLYRDAMRQLKVMGLLYALIVTLEAVLIPIGQMISLSTEIRAAVTRVEVELWDMHPMAILTFCVIAPLMALSLFHFLTERAACDFYHSIPQTRTCLFTSFAAAILTWSLGLQWGTTILSMAIHGCLAAYFTMDVAAILTVSVQISAAAVFVAGAVLIAVSLTGTSLTNLVVSLMIIFVPRGLMYVIQQSVGGALTIVSSDRYLSFLGNGWNVVTGSIFGVLTYADASPLYSLKSGAYTAAVGILYLILACVLFNRRKSETAGSAAVHPRIQLIFRLIPALVFCLIPDILIFDKMAEEDSLGRSEIYALFILYLVGVLLYFLYELITTKKWRNLVKALPGLGVLAAVNLLLIFGMYGMMRGVLAYSPSAEDMDYVCISGSTSYIYDVTGNNVTVPGYLSSRVAQIQLTDENIKELVAQRLEESIAYDSSRSVRESSNSSSISIREVAIGSGSRVTYRRLRFSQSDLVLLADYLLENEEVQSIYMELPDSEDVNLTLVCDGLDGNPTGTAAVYEALKQDIANMGFEDWYVYCADQNGNSYERYFTGLYMYYKENGKTTGSNFTISDATPLAAAAYLEAAWDSQTANREELVSFLEEYAELLNSLDSEFLSCDYNGNFDVLYEGGKAVSSYSVNLSDPEQVGGAAGSCPGSAGYSHHRRDRLYVSVCVAGIQPGFLGDIELCRHQCDAGDL